MQSQPPRFAQRLYSCAFRSTQDPVCRFDLTALHPKRPSGAKMRAELIPAKSDPTKSVVSSQETDIVGVFCPLGNFPHPLTPSWMAKGYLAASRHVTATPAFGSPKKGAGVSGRLLGLVHARRPNTTLRGIHDRVRQTGSRVSCLRAWPDAESGTMPKGDMT